MKSEIENPTKDSSGQLDLIKRTKEELVRSIKEKREKEGLNAKLDPEEEALFIQEMHEEHNDVTGQYRPGN